MSNRSPRTGTILDKIVDHKRLELVERRQARPIDALEAEARAASPARDAVAALQTRGVSLIAEIKRASPSKGLLHPDLDPTDLAHTYEDNGAAAISVLTDQRFFQGSLDDLRLVREAVNVPVLRKDFVFDPYQVYEARAAGADLVLLIVAILSDQELAALYRLVRDLHMSALIEVHDEGELARALAVGPCIVGINNRDLHTFTVDLGTTARLRPQVPDDVVLVSESGVHTPKDVERLAALGADAMLVGESLVKAQDVGAQVRELVNAGK
jgi:indole-3-glycerol phosphate synthase